MVGNGWIIIGSVPSIQKEDSRVFVLCCRSTLLSRPGFTHVQLALGDAQCGLYDNELCQLAHMDEETKRCMM